MQNVIPTKISGYTVAPMSLHLHFSQYHWINELNISVILFQLERDQLTTPCTGRAGLDYMSTHHNTEWTK